ncbi:hypothetical protein [Azotobacter chroococcum]|uniref:hypothetical protein n=1 Tax=Azotobacter chroococcum TaxID=353 RepID=UPI00058A25C2|nr:hypothetical protein [Azotobacter chroococcum]
MSIYEEMKADLKELVKLVGQAEQYNAAVGYGALRPDEDTNRLHLQRAVRIDELSRKYGLV